MNMKRSRDRDRERKPRNTGAGSRQMEQQTAGGSMQQGDDPDLRMKPGGMQHEQQGGAGAQPGSTGMGDAEARRGGGRRARKNSERDRGDPENR
jgi:hypothetical protein